jgi:hypothetical protein
MSAAVRPDSLVSRITNLHGNSAKKLANSGQQAKPALNTIDFAR